MHSKITGIDLISDAAVGRFLAAAFLGGILTQIVAIHVGLRSGGAIWLWLTMWMPALAALTTSRAARMMTIAALRRSGGRWLGLGLLVGFAPGLLKAIFLALGSWGRWDGAHFELAPGGGSIKAIHHLGVVMGAGPQGFPHFALNLVLSMTLGAAITTLVGGLGEELGWRAVLQPWMERRFGPIKGTVLVGLIWGYWHLPVNLAGYNDPVHPVLTAFLLFPLGTVALSFGLAWLMRRSNSVWPAALAHGANNTISVAFLLVARGWSADMGTELLGLLVVGGVFAGLSLRRERARSPAELAIKEA